MKTLDFKPKLVSAIRNYNKQTFMADLMAGLIVGIVALPLAIAFGIASGVSPEKGIITAIVAGFAISALGGSKVQIGGPTGAFIVIVAGIINQYGIQGLTIATLMAGVFLIGFGLLRLGTIIKYIPYPIIVGFTSGIAVTIFTTQVKDLLGMQMDAVPSDFIEKWIAYFQNLTHIDPWSAGVGLVSVAIIASAPKFSKRIPGSLIAIIVMTVVVLLLKQYAGVTSIETIGDRFSISSQLPDAVVPELSWETIKGLVAPALTIAILGAIESLLSATVAAGVIDANGQDVTASLHETARDVVRTLGTPSGGHPNALAIPVGDILIVDASEVQLQVLASDGSGDVNHTAHPYDTVEVLQRSVVVPLRGLLLPGPAAVVKVRSSPGCTAQVALFQACISAEGFLHPFKALVLIELLEFLLVVASFGGPLLMFLETGDAFQRLVAGPALSRRTAP